MIKRYFSGLRFGMLLQIAIGPMCLMVFNTAKNAGFWVAMSLVLMIIVLLSTAVINRFDRSGEEGGMMI